MSDRPTTEWCRGSSTMLKHRPTDRSHTCRPPDAFSDWTHQTVQEGTESNGYRGTGPGERVGSVNERSHHHRVVSGQLHDAQTSTHRPHTSVLRSSESHIFTPLTLSANRLPGCLIENIFARALNFTPHTFHIDAVRPHGSYEPLGSTQ